jgi:nitrite reductase/ring-hydroxylating ferredoxin subunit
VRWCTSPAVREAPISSSTTPEPRSPAATRRQFLRGLVTAAVALVAGATGTLAGARSRRARVAKVTLAAPTGDGVVVYREVVLVRAGGELRAFSSRCPHLGCRLAGTSGGELVCPCHGSRFGLDGKRHAGPAAADLTALEVVASPEAGRVDVVLPR